MSLLVLSAADVEIIAATLLPTQLMDLMRQVFGDFAAAKNWSWSSAEAQAHASSAQRPASTSISHGCHTTLLTPSWWYGVGTAIKIASAPQGGTSSSAVPATTVVMDTTTGIPKAIINSSVLTAMRTAAGSALATTLLWKNKDPPTDLCLFGAGLQIIYHAKVFLHPDLYGRSIKRVTVVNRSDNERLKQVMDLLRQAYPGVEANSILSADKKAVMRALGCADVICTATGSTEPLFPSGWVKPGAHLNLIGSHTPEMREVDEDLVHQAASIIIEAREACVEEAGDLLQAGWNSWNHHGLAKKITELGDYINRIDTFEQPDWAPPIEKESITIFKSVGVGIQDVAIATLIVQMAEERGIGTRIPYD